jgi:predicted ATPase
VRAQHVSDGAILVLGFIALSHLPEPPSLLLLEEPENGIYPKRLEQIIHLLKEFVHHKRGTPFPQIIMTTHSPYVLSFFEPEEVTFLSRPPAGPDGPVRARPLRDAPNIRERMGGGFYLGELWYNLTEEDLFGEP